MHAHLANPLLQEKLSFVPMATCFDYARDPGAYDPEASWETAVTERFGADNLEHWRALRLFCERDAETAGTATFSEPERKALEAANGYLRAYRGEGWCREFEPWRERMERALR